MTAKIRIAKVIAGIFIATAAMAPLANAAPTDDACSLLTAAQVSSAVNVPVGAGTYVTPTFKKTCTWTATGSATPVKYVTVMLQSIAGYEGGKNLGVAKTVTITPASGVGDEGYYLAVGTNVGLIVKKGNAAFKVAVYGSIPLEKKEALEKTLAQEVFSKF
jgi:hypothetical protein